MKFGLRHMTRQMAAGSAALVMAACIGAPAEAGPLVTNGNFLQTATTSPGGYLCNNTISGSCSSQLTDWTATCAKGGCGGSSTPSSILFAGTSGSAFNGNRGLYWTTLAGVSIGDVPGGGNELAIDGDPNYTSILTQLISGLTIGDTYVLQFYQAAAQQKGQSGATTEQWEVSLGASPAEFSTLIHDPSQHASPWTEQTMTFVATANSEILKFVALGTPGGEPPVCLLGDVSMSVPEPSTLGMCAAGLAALGLMRRRRAAG
jgi:hypothetical protein